MDVASTAALSGLAAGCVAVLATVAVERLGGVAGGLIATLPTTIIPAAAGLAAALSPEDFAAAMFAIPPGMLVNVGVLSLWRYAPDRLPPAWTAGTRVGALAAASVALWAAGATAFVLATPLHGVAVGVVCTLAIAAAGVAMCVAPLPAPKGERRVGFAELAARGGAAALAIGAAVALGSVDDVLGGVAATFPAIFLTTMVALALAHGEAVPLGATGPMVLGSSAVAAFALLAAALVPALGGGRVAGALALTWVLSVGGVSLPAAALLRWRQGAAGSAGAASALLRQATGLDGRGAAGEDEIDAEFGSGELAPLTTAGPAADDDMVVIRMAAVGAPAPPRRAADGAPSAAGPGRPTPPGPPVS